MNALDASVEIQTQSSEEGFLDSDISDVPWILKKLTEEREELLEAILHKGPDDVKDELGDVFFVLVRLAMAHGFTPEDALKGANEKFDRRMNCVRRYARERGTTIAGSSRSLHREWWAQAKVEVG